MNRFYIAFLSLIIICMISSQPSVLLASGFTSQCRYFRVSGFTLYASCKTSSGNYVSRSIYFGNCFYNYYGYLQTDNQNETELTTRRCNASMSDINCTCQQPDLTWQSCSISMDNVFYWDGNYISC